MEVIHERRKQRTRLPCVAVAAAIILVSALALGLGLGLGFQKQSEPKDYVQVDSLVDCYLKGDSSKKDCEKLGCEWRNNSDLPSRPSCTYPPLSPSVGYTLEGKPSDGDYGWNFTLQKNGTKTPFLNIDKIAVSIECQDIHRLRVKIYDPNQSRFEVPNVNITNNKAMCNSTMFSINYTVAPHFGIQVKRVSTGTLIFNTSLPGMAFSDQFLQLTTRLPSSHVYGFGEHNHRRFKHDMNWKKWTIFTRDSGVVDAWNLYGAHPFYMNLEEDGNANGVFLKNSNAMDIILQPDPFPAISYRVIGGILDFYIFLGPTPEAVIQQYNQAVGLPVMPPYWSLGFQLCRWDYGSLAEVKKVVKRNRDAGIPYDVQYGDIDYMYNKLVFTYDSDKFAGLPEFIEDLHSHGQRYIIILDPGIATNHNLTSTAPPNMTYPPLNLGLEKNVFLRDPRNDSKSINGFLQGEVWPGTVLYPDFSHENATDWWKTLIKEFYEKQGIKYDALWIDMNEPSSFIPGSLTGCEKNRWNHPPYVPNILGHWPDGRMYDKTTCMDATSSWGKQYDTHSLYGFSMSMTTFNAMRAAFPEKRPLVLTRSSFSGTGHYAQHWLGDNQSRWPQLKWSITGMLEFNMFGFPYVGADICGFWYNTTEEMCTRWMLLGAFYPFARNHNARGDDGQPKFRDQDPAAFGEKLIRISRDILHTRYKLLPFLYTLFHHSHTEGATVVRPLLNEFPTDKSTWGIDEQFLWGPCLLISPALRQGQTQVEAYFPTSARWYDYFDSGKQITSGTRVLETPLDKINVHVRGGHVLPWQQSAVTTTLSRNNTLGLIVALDDQFSAVGELFWDDGESFETFLDGTYLLVNFSCQVDTIDIHVVHNGYSGAKNLVFDEIKIWGLKREPHSITSDGTALAPYQITYNPSIKTIRLSSLNLNITSNHTITWRH